jgi:hypothetical protein
MQAGMRRSGGETVSRLLDELCLPGAAERVREQDKEKEKDKEHHLKEYVEGEARELSPELFSKLMADLHQRIQHMMRR